MKTRYLIISILVAASLAGCNPFNDDSGPTSVALAEHEPPVTRCTTIVSGDQNTVIVEQCTGDEDANPAEASDPLNLDCVEEPIDRSAIVCQWNDGLAHQLFVTAPSYGTALSGACLSPCTFDPEVGALVPTTHTITLQQSGVDIAGPETVQTQT